MSDQQRVVVRVSKQSDEYIRQLAEERNITVGEAADLLIKIGEGRRQALARYIPPPRQPRGESQEA